MFFIIYEQKAQNMKVEKMLVFLCQFLVIFCRIFGYLFFLDVYISIPTPHANSIYNENICMISKITHKNIGCVH